MNIRRGMELFKNKALKIYRDASKKMKKIISSKPTVNEILEDIETNHNYSWYQEIFNRNKNNLNDVAILYKGNKIKYGELFFKANQYAKSLRSMGVGEGSEIPVCLSNCPEIVYLMAAASLIGAKLNIFGPNYPTDYITEIINGTNSGIIFVEDNYFEKVKPGVDASKVKKIAMISLADSLKNGVNVYLEMETHPEIYTSKVDDFKKNDERILSQSEFIKTGESYKGKIKADSNLDTEFVITYTSGSTNEKRPKAIVHSARSFITVGRFHNKDLNGGFSLKPFTFLAHIPTYSNTNLVSCISDALIQGGQLSMEPCYNEQQFLHTLMTYKPHYVAATKSFWLSAAKRILYDPKYKDVKLENLFLAFSCGEALEINEETFINTAMKQANMGTSVTHTPFSVVKMSEAAGDCEHGSILYTLFRAYGNLKPKTFLTGEAEGLKHFPFVEIAVLDGNGKKLGPGQLGRLVANSPCTMKEYKNNPQATSDFFIKDADGKTWADMSVYGYIDENDRVFIRGRIPKKGENFPPFLVAKRILKDRENVLSCEVVKDEVSNCFIAHIELHPESSSDLKMILSNALDRCREILDQTGCKLYFNIHSFENGFALTGSGKRDVKKLKNMGLTLDCIDSDLFDLNPTKKIQGTVLVK